MIYSLLCSFDYSAAAYNRGRLSTELSIIHARLCSSPLFLRKVFVKSPVLELAFVLVVPGVCEMRRGFSLNPREVTHFRSNLQHVAIIFLTSLSVLFWSVKKNVRNGLYCSHKAISALRFPDTSVILRRMAELSSGEIGDEIEYSVINGVCTCLQAWVI